MVLSGTLPLADLTTKTLKVSSLYLSYHSSMSLILTPDTRILPVRLLAALFMGVRNPGVVNNTPVSTVTKLLSKISRPSVLVVVVCLVSRSLFTVACTSFRMTVALGTLCFLVWRADTIRRARLLCRNWGRVYTHIYVCRLCRSLDSKLGCIRCCAWRCVRYLHDLFDSAVADFSLPYVCSSLCTDCDGQHTAL